MWSVLSEDQKKRLLKLGGVGTVLILGAGLLLLMSSPPEPEDPEPALAEVRQAEASRDVAKLTRVVSDSNDRKAAAAISALVRVAPRDARPVVQRAMGDPRPVVRAQAIQWYPRVADRTNPADVTPVQQAMRIEKSTDVMIAILKALGEMKVWDSLEQVYQKMNHEDRAVRVAAASAAQEILFLDVMASYDPDDPPPKRQAAIQRFRNFSAAPGRRDRYMEWLREVKQRQGQVHG